MYYNGCTFTKNPSETLSGKKSVESQSGRQSGQPFRCLEPSCTWIDLCLHMFWKIKNMEKLPEIFGIEKVCLVPAGGWNNSWRWHNHPLRQQNYLKWWRRLLESALNKKIKNKNCSNVCGHMGEPSEPTRFSEYMFLTFSIFFFEFNFRHWGPTLSPWEYEHDSCQLFAWTIANPKKNQQTLRIWPR